MQIMYIKMFFIGNHPRMIEKELKFLKTLKDI